MARKINKIIHCTWAGGGSIEKIKTLQGIKSWLEHALDYQVWVWWDDAHQYNMAVRKTLNKNSQQLRKEYDESSRTPNHPFRGTAASGRDIHNIRFSTKGMDKDQKLALTVAMVKESLNDMAPLRELAADEKYEGRLKLCNLRSHEFLTGMQWLNQDAYHCELTHRGMFAAAASDILRYEALYNYGGIYLDVDIELTKAFGELSVEDGMMLAALTPDKHGEDYQGSKWPGRTDLELVEVHGDKSLYLSNCAMAANKGSIVVDLIRKAIHSAYEVILNSDSPLENAGLLKDYWQSNITRSTLDITGPNIVREVMMLYAKGTPVEKIPSICSIRLINFINNYRSITDNQKKPEDFEVMSRPAYVWRDDDVAQQWFWQWVARYAALPMSAFKLDTDGAEESDCRKAGNQKLKAK
ncbi:TcdA/TcdB catalytic glycosyltransferase domain-containing protein [Pseudoalteromonas luteoviolacea]|uniref:GT44 domain-containing protein n=1 Tax=Pseudoalteromonas luteoviolacea NCIMB 1942 TaxID=1365253 RepID=A0A167GK98_9GAMM|nr:TcdA/TcdB catalytic glycosyltransferase domain-containing protein [Pseudoalteromonas luteoviolacea]KZN55569.1 hypothetical protein N482_24265 [Pseudoalteromonas luteoviolacea NCIMB 1942]